MRARAFTGTLLLIALALSANLAYPQVPQGISYQAVIRDGSGNLLANKAVGLKITLENASGVDYYTETHSTTSNGQGVITVIIGGGTVVGGNAFTSIPWKNGDIFIKVEVDPNGGTAYAPMGDPTKLESVPYSLYAASGLQGPAGTNGISIQWLGELASAPDSPTLNQAYYNTSDKKSYIWNGSVWNVITQDGAQGLQGSQGMQGDPGTPGSNGVSIQWLGALASAPDTPTLNQAYYNSTNKKSYIWNGAAWNIITQDGAQGPQGAQGSPGTGLTNKGNWTNNTAYASGDYVFDRSSTNPAINSMWICQTSFTSTTQPYLDLTHWSEFQAPSGPQGIQGEPGVPGSNGISIKWLGALASAPESPSLNHAYYNTTDKKSYIWNGSAWSTLAQDGMPIIGTTGQTLYHNGTTWVASSALINSGSNIGVGTTPTQNLDVNGNARLRGTLYDYNNSSGSTNQLLTRGFSGVLWQSLPTVGIPSGVGSPGQVALWSGANTLQGLSNITWASSLQVTSNPTALPDDPIFEVRNKDGKVVFGVYQGSVRVYVDDAAVKGTKGGFAVGGLSGVSKGGVEYLSITPDSARIFVNEVPTSKGTKGGFAVGGLSGVSKATTRNLMYVGIDSTRIYIDSASTVKGTKGGFAVGGLSGVSKGSSYDLLKVTADSTRIYVDDKTTKGTKGGFAVGGLSGVSKGGKANFFNIETGEKYIINPSQARILWYPLKNAFLAGQVLVEHPDSVGVNSFSTGYESKAIGQYSQALGYKAVAKGQNSTAIGVNAIAKGVNAFALGKSAKATGADSYAFGKDAKSTQSNSFAFGDNASSINNDAYAFGSGAIASGPGSYAFGSRGRVFESTNAFTSNYTLASGTNAFAFGLGTTASGIGSIAIGTNSLASGWGATAIGVQDTASSSAGTAIGFGCTAKLNHSNIAMGEYSTATGYTAIAGGFWAVATGQAAISLGEASVATGRASFAAGFHSTAAGGPSLSVGDATQANNWGSVAFGWQTISSADHAVTLGEHTTAKARSSLVIGQYNILSGSPASWIPNEPAFVIGNGSDYDHPSNAFTVLKNGMTGINCIPAYMLDVDGQITSRYGDAIRLRNPAYSTLMHHDGSDFYLLVTNFNDPDGSWNSYRPLRVQFSTGNVYMGSNNNGTNFTLAVQSNGKVGVGTTNPQSNLEVLVSGTNGYAGIGINSTVLGGKNITLNQGVAGRLNFTVPGVIDLVTMDFDNYRMGINNTAPSYPLQVGTNSLNGNGAYLSAGGTWTAGSSRSFKDRFITLNISDVLRKIENIDIKGWYYKRTNEYHIGPVAEDFFDAFGTGDKTSPDANKYLSSSDVAGVSLIAVQELIKQNNELKQQLEKQKKEFENLKTDLEAIKAMLKK